jgi:hypothetical protein
MYLRNILAKLGHSDQSLDIVEDMMYDNINDMFLLYKMAWQMYQSKLDYRIGPYNMNTNIDLVVFEHNLSTII